MHAQFKMEKTKSQKNGKLNLNMLGGPVLTSTAIGVLPQATLPEEPRRYARTTECKTHLLLQINVYILLDI